MKKFKEHTPYCEQGFQSWWYRIAFHHSVSWLPIRAKCSKSTYMRQNIRTTTIRSDLQNKSFIPIKFPIKRGNQNYQNKYNREREGGGKIFTYILSRWLYLRCRNTSWQKFNEIPSLHNDIGVPSLSSCWHCHTSLNLNSNRVHGESAKINTRNSMD